MKNVPKFLVGPFRSVLRLALQEIQATDLGRCERGWKHFLLAPQMLLFRRPRGGLISREKLTDRCAKFARGEWTELLAWSHACAEEAAVASRRRQRRPENQEELRAARALTLLQLGELSSARQALEEADLAPPNAHTLQELQRRPGLPRAPISRDLLEMSPPEFQLEEDLAAGPSGMTNKHNRILLDNHSDAYLMFLAGEQSAQARVSPAIVRLARQCRMTALRKDDGGVREIVAGDRRLVSRTMARQ